MTEVYRALDEPSGTRTDYWQHVIGSALIPMSVRFDEPLGPHDWVRTGRLGQIRVTEWSGGADESTWSRQQIRRTGADLCKVIAPTGSALVADHDGRRIRLPPGSFAVIDLSAPFRCVHGGRHGGVGMTFPRTLSPLREDELARLNGVPMSGERGTGALVGSLLRQLPRHLDAGGGAAGARLGTAILDLLAATFAARLDRGSAVRADVRRNALRTQVHAFIEEHLGDPGLDPATIATAHHVSVRYLHKLFEDEDCTVAAWIRRRRLERSRRDLMDTAGNRTVAAIASARGFASLPHFSRLFRDAYGVPPGEYRRRFSP